MKKRIIALFLCLSILLPMFVGSVTAEEGGYSANVGRYAVLADNGYGVQAGNFTDITTGGDMIFGYEEFEPGTIFKITDWYLDSATQSLWYAVEIYAGGLIPESQEFWPAMPWVMQDYVGEAATGDSLVFLDGCDICGKPDCGGHESVGDSTKVLIDGVEIQQLTMPQFDKPTVSAATTLTGEVTYQWQILADRETELWVNIYGEDQPELTLSYGMVASLLDSNSQAQVRCVTRVGETKSVSEALTITLEPYVIPAAPDAEDPTEPTEETTAPTQETMEPTEETTESTEGVTELAEEIVQLPEVEITYTGTKTLADGSDDELHTHDILVAYTFEGTNIVAAPSYTASISHGDPFTETVTFPTVLGYEPIVNINDSWVQQGSYTFDISSVTEDVIVDVRYRPALVRYKVYVHLQNVDNDGYPESVIEDSGLAYTGSTDYEFDQQNVKYPGFYQLPYEKPPIAADGSTTVEIYFDRFYYLMKFDLDGGYGAEPIYARYGMPLSVSEPTKAGHEFIGWDGNGDGKADPIPATMPHENTSFKALWREENTVKVTVVFWGENADDEKYSYMPDYTKEVYVKPGISFTYTEAADLVCGYNTEHIHSESCGYSCGQVEHSHSVGYDCYAIICPLEEHFHSEDCNTCNGETHNHTTACYSNVGAIYTGYLYGAPENPADGRVYGWSNNNKYIYIDGSWYRYTGNTTNGKIAPTTCGKTEGSHTHTDACIGCGKIEHAHSVEDNCYDMTPVCGLETHSHLEQCYNCGQREHSHSNSCHLNQNRPEHAFWQFVKSDTVTVKADGTTVVNVYYDRTEFTLTFRYNNATVATITDKWGAKISDEFAKAPFNTTHNGYAWQCTESSKYSAALQTLDIMPQFNATFNRYNRSSTTLKTIYYYVQIPGTTVSSTQWPTNSNNFTLLKQVDTYFNYATYEEEYHEMVGYVRYSKSVAGFSNNQKNFSSSRRLDLYYLCDSFDLTFNNGLDDVTETVTYGLSLEDYASYIPEAPDIYEPGSVEFDGWYQNPECTGEEYILSEHTMPANDLLLYAKWKPVVHHVRVFLTEDLANGGEEQIVDFYIPHGELVPEDQRPAKPTNGSYEFIGWFYRDEQGRELAFDFSNMPVKDGMHLYAKWSSNVMVNYTIRYVTKDENGNEIEIVSPTEGSGLAGYNKTFNAADAPDGFFPLVKSTSLTLDLDETKNVCTFYYVQQDAVPYTVRYVTIIDGQEVDLSDVEGIVNAPETKYVSENRKAVVTENFVPVAGYLPDASHKTLVVSADGENNVIKFVYTQDDVNAYYIVSDWIQDVDGATWIRRIREEGSNKIGTEYTRNSITIPGFTYDEGNANNLSSGTLKKNEILELNFYYTRNKYPYQISYLEYGTDTELMDPLVCTGDDKAYYGGAVNAKGDQIPGIPGYRFHSAQGCTIGVEDNEDSLHKNVVKVYYTRITGDLKVTKNVKVSNSDVSAPSDQAFEFILNLPKGVTGSYSVTIGGNTQEIEAVEGKLIFQLKDGESALIQGLPQGPTDNKYRYTIEETQVPCFVSSFSSSNPIVVSEGTITEVTCINEYKLPSLTISKSNAEDGQVFVYEVKDSKGKIITVTVVGNSSTTIYNLLPGDYTVTQKNLWSWRYNDEMQNVTLSNEDVTVAFGGGVQDDHWLDGNSQLVVNRRGG